MTHELDDLYQDLILSHGRRPRNFRAIEDADRSAQGLNPLCGDEVTVYLKVENDHITDASFQGVGCAICKASASMMTEAIMGKSRPEVEAVFDDFRQHIVSPADVTANNADMGDLSALAGVGRYPMRVKCAILPWHAMHAALHNAGETVTTE